MCLHMKVGAHIKQWLDFKDLKVSVVTALTRLHTNNHSLNENTNVRKCLNKNIYTPGVGFLEKEGGAFL